MTYRDLLAQLQRLDNEQLDCNVSVYVESFDEWFSGAGGEFAIIREETHADGVLDNNHPYLIVGRE